MNVVVQQMLNKHRWLIDHFYNKYQDENIDVRVGDRRTMKRTKLYELKERRNLLRFDRDKWEIDEKFDEIDPLLTDVCL